MLIYTQGLKSSYDVEHLARLFFKDGTVASGFPREKQNIIVARCGSRRLFLGVRHNGRVYVQTAQPKQEEKPSYTLSVMLYHLLVKITGKRPAWGLLTGVRPVRLIHDMKKQGMSDSQIEHRFLKDFDTSAEKFSLAMSSAKNQQKIIGENTPQSYSLYVSIPFCPSRCSYCSFVSRTAQSSQKLIDPYVDRLCEELMAISDIASQNSLSLETIYIGGGTPTSLSAMQLKRLMECIKANFDIENVKEYTVEAGRPDCTDFEKLCIIKELGASRISINPQTLNDEVLAAIGRKHTVKDVIDCYNDARKAGHNNINMDLIAGLPLDSLESFTQSLKGTIALKPENITVHTLTLKRASNIVIEHRDDEYDDVSAMIDKLYLLGQSGYEPYYLYRQKNTLQNLENTGFSKKGFEGLYNIFIMEEVHTIISAGAGGVTKLVEPNGNRLERIFNHKYPLEYIENFDEMIRRKNGITDFYNLFK